MGTSKGTFLEAAFVDPAYSWPPQEGEGKYAVELKASQDLMKNDTDETASHTESPVEEKEVSLDASETKTSTKKKGGMFGCCAGKSSTTEAVIDPEKKQEIEASNRAFVEEREAEASKKYKDVPEGILIYRLDTLTHKIELVSTPSSKTDMAALMTEMVISAASGSNDSHRRGIFLTGIDGSHATLVACEQRTAISWLEALEMMLTRAKGKAPKKKQALTESEYLNLTAYSNNLIRTGNTPSGDGKSSGAIFYSVETQANIEEEFDEETLESVAKRRAVIRDSWDFYRMICSLLRDRKKYEEVFEKLKLDPVYPYLASMTGLADPGENGYENFDKQVVQKKQPEYASMSNSEICKDLVDRAKEAQQSLVEICKALAGSLGMEEVGVGPIKEYSAALKKAEKKYGNNPLKVTDYCRALLVVKDVSTLLALLELARNSFGPIIRRVKLSSLKEKNRALVGGYRDCKINLELKGHICEIQIHLWPMWCVCGVDGYRHYRHCQEYSTDSFDDPFESLSGLDKKTRAEIIVIAEEAVSGMPVDSLEWHHEKYILDYYAEIGLFIQHGLWIWAETTLRALIRLRSASPDIGVDHHETYQLQKHLEQVLRAQKKFEEADEVQAKLEGNERLRSKEKEEASSILTACLDPSEFFENLMDPNKKEREEEEKTKAAVKASKKQWKKIREERFDFLNRNNEEQQPAQ